MDAKGEADAVRHVVARDWASVQRKVDRILAEGAERLQVVTDFDRTLTSCFINGTMAAASHGVIERTTMLGPEFPAILRNNFNTYYPREISSTLSREEREGFMTEWWTKTHEIFLQYKLREEMIPKMLAEALIELRPGADKLLTTFAQLQLPVLVFSAGVANVLEVFLKQKGVLTSNIHIVSNRMLFDKDGVICGFEGELIHSLNKNGKVLSSERSTWVHDKARHNILLLGDNLSDVEMVHGLECSTLLTVGFLNDKVHERLQSYLEHFDIVITDDSSTDYVQTIADALLAQKQPAQQ